MAKHREDGRAEKSLLDTTEQPATAPPEPEPAPESPEPKSGARSWFRPRILAKPYILPAATVAVVLLGAAAWFLTEPSIPARPPATPVSAKGNQAVEGFGQPSPNPSTSVRPSPSLRVSPSPTTGSTTTTSTAGSAAPPAAHYKLDESSGTTTSDASGHGKTATLHGGAAFAAGRLGNGVNLSGSSQYLSLPTGILSGATSFTVSAWVRLDTVTTWSRVFDFGSGTGVNMFLTPRSNAGTARFGITTTGSGGEQRINAPAALPSGTWTHVAVTLSGGTGVLYVNRAEVARATGLTLTPASLGSTASNWIGRSQYPQDPYLDGIVDEVRVYTHALSASEIASLP